jgi:hypothetical protein
MDGFDLRIEIDGNPPIHGVVSRFDRRYGGVRVFRS